MNEKKLELFLQRYRDNPLDLTLDQLWERRLNESLEHFRYANHKSRFPAERFRRLLIIGAGIGAEVTAAKQLGYDAIGITRLVPEQFSYFKQKEKDIFDIDMHDLPFPNNSFDVIYCAHTLEHSISPWIVSVEIYTVLAENGRVWIALPTWKSSDKDGPSREHQMVLPSWFMEPLFRRSGFRILYSQDTEIRHEYLLERMSIEETKRDNKAIADILSKRSLL